MLRPASPGCGTVSYDQSNAERKSREKAAGMWISGLRSAGPASRSSTETSPAALKRSCRQLDKRYVPLRSSSLTSLLAGISTVDAATDCEPARN